MHRLLRFFKTPKGLLMIILAILTAIAAPGEGAATVARNMGAAVLAAGSLDLIILRLRKQAWQFPSGAILTAMIVTMVVRAQEHWYVPAATAMIAVVSKYLIRTRTANVFNPAAFALVLMFYVFPMGQSWWGSLPDVAPLWLRAALLVGGAYITHRVNKAPMVVSFLGAYFLMFTAAAYLGDPRRVAELFRSPDTDAALYFAFIILTDPPSTPAKYQEQWLYGIIVAAVSFGAFETIGAAYFLLAGVLAGNVWAAWRRVHRHSGAAFSHNMLTFIRELTPLRQGARRA